MKTQVKIQNLFIGKITNLHNDSRKSAIIKTAVKTGDAEVTKLGFAGDNVADNINHGGIHQAVHQLPYIHYPTFAKLFSEFNFQWQKAQNTKKNKMPEFCLLGENISTTILDETVVCIGDLWQCGKVQLQISQPRQPCWKIDTRFGIEAKNGLLKFISENGLSGWYYRVLAVGKIKVGDNLTLISRPNPNLTVRKVWLSRIEKTANCDINLIKEISQCAELTPKWREIFAEKLSQTTPKT